MEKLSTLIVARDCENLLRNCIESIKDISQEIIIIDLGSTDNTMTVAKEYSRKVFKFSVPRDASSPWNEALLHATNPWILYLHPHEMVTPEGRDVIKSLLLSKADAYTCTLRHYTNDSTMTGWTQVLSEFPFAGYYESKSLRLFRSKSAGFEGAITPRIKGLFDKIGESSLLIHQFPEWNTIHFIPKDIPMDADSLVSLGIIKQEEGNFDEALRFYKKALEIDPKKVIAYLNGSFCLLKQDKYADALALIQEGLKNHPKYSGLLNNLATYHIYTKNYVTALTLSDMILAKEVNNYSAHLNKGFCYIALERFDDAIVEFKRAILLNPTNPDIRMNLALAFMHKDEKDNARLALLGLLEIAPKHEGAKALLGKVL